MKYQVCSRCIMDTSDPEIKFDSAGVCNHCHRYDERALVELKHGPQGQKELADLVEVIKVDGKDKSYDCVIGVSGGVDSTMVAYKVKQMGLRPLAIHFDNGWNSELAVSNIEKTMKKLGIDLYTYVIDWNEFRDIQLSFIHAGVANIEAPTDHAIGALLYKMASKYGVKYLISGGNLETEGVMPSSWLYDNKDWKHIKGLHRIFGKVKLKTFPHYGLLHMVYYVFFRGIKFVKVLNYAPYNKNEAMELFRREFDWVPYAGKHYESIFTKFYQAYILPQKFGYDKRRPHLSSLVLSGQMTRDEALKELEMPLYQADELARDKEYVLKKFGLSEMEFDRIMSEKPKSYKEYPSNRRIFENLNKGFLGMVKRFAAGQRK
ncbi:N-acetyl sugar amidotransferase [Bdellovibrio bacteriovorus]|uniref:LPS biosynthesis protein WbpG n=1 Tax=Bdellovibrio bacteriovorus str. Tiberius TaxID=1069642 RepID=K7Z9X1_BDEBC|nr:N-acetyl sugar amidotransferase [Bdellovibrio bacteriovorus]AFY01374.1 LPS biosynthesis protein WbpG [Bdellovibrio bacteriovorus str. Tiberius]